MSELAISWVLEPEEKDKKIVDKFIRNFSELLKKSGGKLNQYVQEDAVDIENEELRKLLVMSLENIILVGLYLDWTVFFQQFEKYEFYSEMDQFLIWMQQYIESSSSAYKETSFVREMDASTLENVLNQCFEEYVVVKNNLVEEKFGLNREQLKVLIKVFKTLIDMIIVNNFSYKLTWKKSYEMFLWEENVFSCFWEIIDKNRSMLWHNVLLQKIASLEEEIMAMKGKYE